jgi:putative ABC transport system substrate-binding protein
MIKRREFITLVGGAAVWPLAARAQQSSMPVVGFLSSESPDVAADRMRAFHQGLSESGYVEGLNVAIEYRWAEGQNDRLPALAAELVRRKVTAIATGGASPAALAAKAITTTIPIIFQVGANPVELGLIASLNRPGGNVTGVTSMNTELAPKRLEVLHELVPTARIVAMLINPDNRNAVETQVKVTQAAAESLGLQLHILHASNENDFDATFSSLPRLRASGLVIGADPYFVGHTRQLAALTIRQAVISVSPFREFPAAGGLMSYGGSLLDQYRLVGVYTGRILKGEKPADLPVQQATKIELIINMKAANALGITVPPTLLGRADEVIE